MLLTKQQLQARNARLIRVYGITVEEYQKILVHQGGVCGICKQPPKRTLHVDHKHQPRDRSLPGHAKRAFVRGLLCWRCNTAIAKFRDNPDHMEAAGAYIRKPPAKHVIKTFKV